MADPQSVRIGLPPDHPSFAGHFPGRPLLPGVVLLSQVLEVLAGDAAAVSLLGAAPKLSAVKFVAPVGPGADLEVRWVVPDTGGRLRFEVWRHAPGDDAGGVLAASGQFEVGPSAAS